MRRALEQVCIVHLDRLMQNDQALTCFVEKVANDAGDGVGLARWLQAA